MPFHEVDALGFEAPAPVGHPARANLPDGTPTGPAIGERLPDFELTDHTGRRVRFHEDRGDAKAAVVFYRSAVW
jgi:hypothetical protein